eukprot:bmy_09563T0
MLSKDEERTDSRVYRAEVESGVASICAFVYEVPGIDGGALTDTSLTDSYFSTSFIGVNGFGSPVETKYPLMQQIDAF